MPPLWPLLDPPLFIIRPSVGLPSVVLELEHPAITAASSAQRQTATTTTRTCRPMVIPLLSPGLYPRVWSGARAVRASPAACSALRSPTTMAHQQLQEP